LTESKTSRALLWAVLGMALLAPAGAAPVAVRGSIEKFGAKTAKIKRVHLRLQHTYFSRSGQQQSGRLDVWFDKEAKRYLATDLWRSVDQAGNVRSTWSSGVLVNEKGATTWYERDGGLGRCYRRPAEAYLPSEDGLPAGNHVRACILDALFGYNNLSRAFSFKRARSPLPDQKGLHWFAIQVNATAPQRKRLRWMAGGGSRTWFGFDPRSGWLTAIVTWQPNNRKSVILVKQIDVDPDTKGIFVLPDEVRRAPILNPETGQAVPADER